MKRNEIIALILFVMFFGFIGYASAEVRDYGDKNDYSERSDQLIQATDEYIDSHKMDIIKMTLKSKKVETYKPNKDERFFKDERYVMIPDEKGSAAKNKSLQKIVVDTEMFNRYEKGDTFYLLFYRQHQINGQNVLATAVGSGVTKKEVIKQWEKSSKVYDKELDRRMEMHRTFIKEGKKDAK